MAHIYRRLNANETAGEKSIYASLSTLSDDWFVYSQYVLKLPHGDLNPDFILVNREVGLIILEVKDWVWIEKLYHGKALVLTVKDGEPKMEDSPIQQARDKSTKLNSYLTRNPKLTNAEGKLAFPWKHVGFLPRIPNSEMKWIRSKWSHNHIYGGTEVSTQSIESSLRAVPPHFKSEMTLEQLNILRGIIDSNLQLSGKGVLDIDQESIAKEDLRSVKPKTEDPYSYQLSFNPSARIDNASRGVPQEVVAFSKSQSVRLIRGFAGTGKTDVLILRSCYLKDLEPDSRILLTTFNKSLANRRLAPAIKPLSPTIELKRIGQICQEIFEQYTGERINPQGIKGNINRVLNQDRSFSMLQQKYDLDFLEDEIQWIKETGLTNEDDYVKSTRLGRGGVSGISLSKKQKMEIHEFFKKYQESLDEIRVFDWPDFYHFALNLLKTGKVEYKKYDEILIDEAQHLAPRWVELINLLLKPNGSLFLCEDPSQSVFRAFTWKQKGVAVSGRTKWLRVPYRSSREILEVAYALIEGNKAVRMLLEEFETPEKLDMSLARSGSMPEMHIFVSWSDERDFVRNEINKLVQRGYLAEEIAILHTQNYVIKEFEDLKHKGVFVDEVRTETGMEYKVVFIPHLQAFFNKREENDRFTLERNQAKLYTAVSRTIEQVYLSHNSKQPKEIEPILNKVKIIDHAFLS